MDPKKGTYMSTWRRGGQGHITRGACGTRMHNVQKRLNTEQDFSSVGNLLVMGSCFNILDSKKQQEAVSSYFLSE